VHYIAHDFVSDEQLCLQRLDLTPLGRRTRLFRLALEGSLSILDKLVVP
jgi:hypothetical protein